MEYKDYYQILGVARDADQAAIKRAFRKLARTHHPDVNPGDAAAESRFKDIAEAYEVLGDPEKRAKYDRFGQEYRQYERAGGAPGGFDWGAWRQAGPGVTYTSVQDLGELFGRAGTGGLGGFSDFFEALFGQAAAARQPAARRGADARQPVQITLLEAYRGTRRMLAKNGRRIEVDIPAGVRTGSRVRMRGEGAPGSSGASPGDLYLEIEVLPDERFERRGNDLYTRAEVPLTTAILGGEVRVPTLDGHVDLTVPAGTQNGRKIRLSGKGMPRLGSGGERGNLFVTVEVRLPGSLTEEQRELFVRLRELEPKPRSK